MLMANVILSKPTPPALAQITDYSLGRIARNALPREKSDSWIRVAPTNSAQPHRPRPLPVLATQPHHHISMHGTVLRNTRSKIPRVRNPAPFTPARSCRERMMLVLASNLPLSSLETAVQWAAVRLVRRRMRRSLRRQLPNRHLRPSSNRRP